MNTTPPVPPRGCRWTVLEIGTRKHHWLCRCECGTQREVYRYNLALGKSTNCGCVADEALRLRRLTHGRSGTPEYHAWTVMKRRHAGHVCPRWCQSFELFYADVGPKPGRGYYLRRVTDSAGYGPGNVVWSPPELGVRGKRLTYGGQTASIAGWAKRLGVTRQALQQRLSYGTKTLEEILDRELPPPAPRGQHS